MSRRGRRGAGRRRGSGAPTRPRQSAPDWTAFEWEGIDRRLSAFEASSVAGLLAAAADSPACGHRLASLSPLWARTITNPPSGRRPARPADLPRHLSAARSPGPPGRRLLAERPAPHRPPPSRQPSAAGSSRRLLRPVPDAADPRFDCRRHRRLRAGPPRVRCSPRSGGLRSRTGTRPSSIRGLERPSGRQTVRHASSALNLHWSWPRGWTWRWQSSDLTLPSPSVSRTGSCSRLRDRPRWLRL